MNEKFEGRVEKIDYEQCAESRWFIELSSGEIFCFTDIADTNESHLRLIGKRIKFSAILQIAYITASENSTKAMENRKRNGELILSHKLCGVVVGYGDSYRNVKVDVGTLVEVELEVSVERKDLVCKHVCFEGELKIETDTIEEVTILSR